MSVVSRMEQSLRDLDRRWKGKRLPKAFYLCPDDWLAFAATDPPTVETMWGNNPPTKVTDLAFQDLPVRQSTAKVSRLYDHTSTGRAI
jgi:hypothetical protein